LILKQSHFSAYRYVELTLAYAKKLKEVGFTESQAEVQATTLASVVESEFATQQDLKETEAALKRDIKDVEARLEAKLAETKAELIKWLVGLLFVQAGFIIAMLKL
jgi:adenylosuccinate lyase